MPAWKESLNIKPILACGSNLADADPVPRKLLRDVQRELRKSRLLPGTLTAGIGTARTVREFNAWLGRVYDAADHYRVWLGI